MGDNFGSTFGKPAGRELAAVLELLLMVVVGLTTFGFADQVLNQVGE